MPWRISLSPGERKRQTPSERAQRAYEVWVSEIMAQQTQAATCIPYYEKWLEKWPTVKSLSKATEDDVRSMWKGLGYYSRATRLLCVERLARLTLLILKARSGAQKIMKHFDGRVPSDPKVLEKQVDGVGPYTAGAIASIAYHERVPAVDGNVQRVYARVFAIHANPSVKSTVNHLQRLAEELVPADRPGDYNQALMDLGYFICTPKQPKCGECPLASKCVARIQSRAQPASLNDIEEVPRDSRCSICDPLDLSEGLEVTRYPMAKIKKKAREEETAMCLLEWRSDQSGSQTEPMYLISQRPNTGLLAGLFEFPTVDMEELDTTQDARIAALSKRLGSLLGVKGFHLKSSKNRSALSLSKINTCDTYKHKFSHISRDYMPVHVALLSGQPPAVADKRSRWVAASEILSLSLPASSKTIWEMHTGQLVKKVKTTKRKTPAKKPTNPISGYFGQPQSLPTEAKEFQETQEVVVVQTPPRKKRRIAESSEEE